MKEKNLFVADVEDTLMIATVHARIAAKSEPVNAA